MFQCNALSQSHLLVAGKECVKRGDTVFIGGLSTAQEGLGENACIFCVAIAVIGSARVNTGGVGVEDLKVGTHNRFASVDIENLKVIVHGKTLLIINKVLANVLASNVWTNWFISAREVWH